MEVNRQECCKKLDDAGGLKTQLGSLGFALRSKQQFPTFKKVKEAYWLFCFSVVSTGPSASLDFSHQEDYHGNLVVIHYSSVL